MSKNAKIILAIVIIIAIALIAWCYFGTSSTAVAPVSAPVADESAQASQSQQTAAVASSAPISGLTTSPTDNSNAALDSDMSVMSAQSAALDQDTAAASQ